MIKSNDRQSTTRLVTVSKKLRNVILGARPVARDDCGHILNWETPDGAAAVIADFGLTYRQRWWPRCSRSILARECAVYSAALVANERNNKDSP